MSALTTWFLLVFVPNLYVPFKITLIISIIFAVISGITIIVDMTRPVKASLMPKIAWKVLKRSLLGTLIATFLLAGLPDQRELGALVLMKLQTYQLPSNTVQDRKKI